MRNIALVLVGPPGSGKTMQANLFENNIGFVHINTSQLIKKIIDDSANQNDEIIKKEKEKFYSGILNDDEWVTQLVINEAKKQFGLGKSLVFSSSPRRILEAEKMTPVLIELFGKDKVFTFYYVLPKEESIRRIGLRRLCEKCGVPVMPDDKREICAECGGKIIERSLDDPAKLELRFKEYEEKTLPMVDYLRKNTNFVELDAKPLPEEIFRVSLEKLNSYIRIRFARLPKPIN